MTNTLDILILHKLLVLSTPISKALAKVLGQGIILCVSISQL